MHDLDLIARGADLVQLLAEEDALLRAAAEEDGQVEILHAVTDGTGHGQKRGNAAAACQRHYILRIAQVLIVELALAVGGQHLVAYLQVLQQPVGRKAVGVGAHGDGHLALQRFLGRGADGIGAGHEALTDGQLQGQILAGAEIGRFFAVLALKHEGLGAGAGMLDDLADDQLLIVGVQDLGISVDGIVCLDLVGGSRLNGLFTHLGHVLELEHIQLAYQTYLYIQFRHYLFPPSSHSFISFSALSAIS